MPGKNTLIQDTISQTAPHITTPDFISEASEMKCFISEASEMKCLRRAIRLAAWTRVEEEADCAGPGIAAGLVCAAKHTNNNCQQHLEKEHNNNLSVRNTRRTTSNSRLQSSVGLLVFVEPLVVVVSRQHAPTPRIPRKVRPEQTRDCAPRPRSCQHVQNGHRQKRPKKHSLMK